MNCPEIPDKGKIVCAHLIKKNFCQIAIHANMDANIATGKIEVEFYSLKYFFYRGVARKPHLAAARLAPRGRG